MLSGKGITAFVIFLPRAGQFQEVLIEFCFLPRVELDWLFVLPFSLRYLDGHAQFYRQTIILGSYLNPGNGLIYYSFQLGFLETPCVFIALICLFSLV